MKKRIPWFRGWGAVEAALLMIMIFIILVVSTDPFRAEAISPTATSTAIPTATPDWIHANMATEESIRATLQAAVKTETQIPTPTVTPTLVPTPTASATLNACEKMMADGSRYQKETG